MSVLNVNSFLKFIPNLAIDAGLLQPDHLRAVDRTQAIFHVAHYKGKSPVPLGKKPDEVLREEYFTLNKIERLKNELGLDEAEVEATANSFSQGTRPENAPYFLETLDVLGYLPPAKKQPLL